MARRRVAITLLSAAALVWVGLGAESGPAGATDPAGTVVLASGSSAFPDSPDLAGLTSTLALFRDSAGLESVPLAGGTKTLLVPASHVSYIDAVVGDMVFFGGPSGGRKWFNISDSSTGPVRSAWVAYSADGGLYFHRSSGTWHLIDQNAKTLATTDLGALPATATGFDQIAAGAAGVVVSIFTGAAPNEVYFPAGGGAPTDLDTTGLAGDLTCYSVIPGAAGCTMYTQHPSRTTPVRLSTTGGPPVTGTATTRYIGPVEVTSTHTGWTDQSSTPPYTMNFVTQPAGGGAASKSVVSDPSIAANASTFCLHIGGSLGVDGLYTTPAARGARTAAYLAPADRLRSSGVALTAGRAAWSDTSGTDLPVWSRSITTSGGTITAGSPTLLGSGVGTDGTGFGLPAVSDTKSALTFAAGSTALGIAAVARTNHPAALTFAVGSTALGIAVVDGAGHKTILPGTTYRDTPQISGNHVSYVDAETADAMVYDLVSATTIDLTTTAGAAQYHHAALFGDRAAYGKPNGSVYQVSLSGSPTPAKVADAPLHATSDPDVVTWGDWVAYTQYYRSSGDYLQSSGAKNVRTHTSISLSGDQVMSASNAGVVTILYGSGATQLEPWEGGTVALPGQHFPTPQVDGSIVGWVGTDGAPRVSPLGIATTDRPRSLGDPAVSSTVPQGDTFDLDLPTSAPLASCSVRISGPAPATSTATILTCDANYMAQGEVLAEWQVGASQPTGTYTWTVTASNADGTLLAANGTAASTRGTFSVT